MNYYSVSHLTLYTYSEPITASMMEVRLHPRQEVHQQVLEFRLDISPKAKQLSYIDYLGNHIHIFDVPGKHKMLAIKSDVAVEIKDMPTLPDALYPELWNPLMKQDFSRHAYDMLQPSFFVRTSPVFEAFVKTVGFQKLADPLTTLKDVNRKLYDSLDYDQSVTMVDSPIEVAIENRKGVCQDYAHIMLTVVRQMGIPCRYVSGYLYHRDEQDDRSAVDASHAWVEAWLPTLGWIGFDPTNNLICGERHIRVCIGQDYADTAPTKGVFTGTASTELTVNVQVGRLDAPPTPVTSRFSFDLPDLDHQQFQQQQQQQQ